MSTFTLILKKTAYANSLGLRVFPVTTINAIVTSEQNVCAKHIKLIT